MAIYKYKKYKVSLQHDSKKTQGLRTGDIVRRQYFDGTNLIYSLMCVLDYGKENVVDENTEEIVERAYFIGALLEGDVPKSDEILDFARITNLFDDARSGALYLTGSDEQAPYMDVIDGIGRNSSLCYPSSLASDDYADAESQYVVSGVVDTEYLPSFEGHNRIVYMKRRDVVDYNFIGIQQDFYKYIQNPNRVLVSYKIKASRSVDCKMSLGYQDGTRIDGEDTYQIGTDWQYKLHAVTIDYSGRYLRTLKLDLSAMKPNDEVWIADFNIILLSSVTNFNDASKIRIGKLDGIADPVFGQLDGYGSYIQKLFASKSAHVSGTLTAGDEDGFAATFYAGKIHRNCFINSLDVNFVNSVAIDSAIDNPTGIGNVYKFGGAVTMMAQSDVWLTEHIGETYTFSFWVYTDKACQLSFLQNTKLVRTFDIPESYMLSWRRYKVTFELQRPVNTEGLELTLTPIVEVGSVQVCFVGPQLESGDTVTQYQPTDAVLRETNDYGAWFSRGGIGGTIQNPLLQLNYDGEGGIGTRNQSLLLKSDGSGHLANTNIKWNKQGDVTFGKNVTMTWDNLDGSVKDELVSKSIKIVGSDTFSLLGDATGADPTTSPATITLSLQEENMQSTSSQRQWYYLDGYDYIPFEGENGKTLTIMPFSDYWNNRNNLTIQCVVTLDNGERYVDTFTIRKQYIVGYTIEIASSKGTAYKNGQCETVLTANVYYQGKLVDPEYAASHYYFRWSKYHLPDIENEVVGWNEGIDVTQPTLTLDYDISGQDIFVCELVTGSSFPYDFPLTF